MQTPKRGRRGRRGRRLLTAIIVAVGLLLIVGYAGISVYAYSKVGPVSAHCPATEGFADIGDPTSFTASLTTQDGVNHVVDTTAYHMPPPQTVSFRARDDPRVTIAAWWEPAAALDAPTVVVVHGQNGCRRNSGNLLVAGMLHRHGIAVLLIDMRNHGDSTVDDGQFAAGTDEYRDVLGGLDWLAAQAVPKPRIGAFGFSGGAGSVLIAAGQEPTLAAVWADSPWSDLRVAIDYSLASQAGLPAFLDVGVLLVGQLANGHSIGDLTPLAAAPKLAGRPVYLAAGANDSRLGPGHVEALAAAIEAAGGTAQTWIAPNADHTQAHFLYPAEYEQRLVGFFGPALGGVLAGS